MSQSDVLGRTFHQLFQSLFLFEMSLKHTKRRHCSNTVRTMVQNLKNDLAQNACRIFAQSVSKSTSSSSSLIINKIIRTVQLTAQRFVHPKSQKREKNTSTFHQPLCVQDGFQKCNLLTVAVIFSEECRCLAIQMPYDNGNATKQRQMSMLGMLHRLSLKYTNLKLS